MSFSENLAFSPAEFSGRARLFPLPNLVAISARDAAVAHF